MPPGGAVPFVGIVRLPANFARYEVIPDALDMNADPPPPGLELTVTRCSRDRSVFTVSGTIRNTS